MGRWTPEGKGTSVDIVPTHIKFGVDPSTRCWDIAQKPPKCQNSPLTPIVTKISFPHFSAPGAANPQKGEKTHPKPEYSRMQNLAWIGLRVIEKSLTKNEQKLDAGMWRYHGNRMDARRSQFDLGRVDAYI